MAPVKATPDRLPVGLVGLVATGRGRPSESEFTGVKGVVLSVNRLTNGGFLKAIELAIMFGTKLIPYPPRRTVPFAMVAANPKRGEKSRWSGWTPADEDTPFCPAMMIVPATRSMFEMRLATSELGP